MVNIITTGRKRHIIRSYFSLQIIALKVIFSRLVGRRLEPTWSISLEIGNLFWRQQFTRAFACDTWQEGRAYFDSLQTFTNETYNHTCPAPLPTDPPGRWIIPGKITSKAVLLYLHGGGYSFHAGITHRFAETIAAHTGCRTFALDYRLTPEHPHPAQIEDAMQAYTWILGQVEPSKLVLIGESAGGHLALSVLLEAQNTALPQPAICIGLCPWTDIGARGASLHENDKYDLVQGWMALKFGEYLTDGNVGQLREELSPIFHNFKGLAPIYLQSGGREILFDMIREFSEVQQANGARILHDSWPHDTHVFQANGLTTDSSAEAFARINAAISTSLSGKMLPKGPRAL